MAISPVCDRCGEELADPGGLLFGPPNYKGVVTKQHLCCSCFVVLDVQRKWWRVGSDQRAVNDSMRVPELYRSCCAESELEMREDQPDQSGTYEIVCVTCGADIAFITMVTP